MDEQVRGSHSVPGGAVVTGELNGHGSTMKKSYRVARGFEVPARGFSVERRHFPGGLVESSGVATHVISVLAGQPVRVDCIRGGRHFIGLLKRGDMEIIAKGEGGRWIDEGPADLVIMRIEPSFLNRVAANMGFDPKSLEILPRVQARDPQIEHVAWALEAALIEGEGEVDPAFVQAMGAAVAARLIKAHSIVRHARVQRALSRKQTALVCDHIDTNLTERLSLADLAALVGVSTSHFKTLFKAAVGVPAHRYVMRRRVARAVELIQAGERRLADVASETGFAHQSHLARAMRSVTGQTPGELQRASR